jgi:hypothetical protein
VKGSEDAIEAWFVGRLGAELVIPELFVALGQGVAEGKSRYS